MLDEENRKKDNRADEMMQMFAMKMSKQLETIEDMHNQQLQQLLNRIEQLEDQQQQQQQQQQQEEQQQHQQQQQQQQLKEMTKTLKEVTLRQQLHENSSLDGKLLWKINNFAERTRQACSSTVTALHSAPLYTSKYGYKLCGRLYLNGDGLGRATHLSLFVVVMRGEFFLFLLNGKNDASARNILRFYDIWNIYIASKLQIKKFQAYLSHIYLAPFNFTLHNSPPSISVQLSQKNFFSYFFCKEYFWPPF